MKKRGKGNRYAEDPDAKQDDVLKKVILPYNKRLIENKLKAKGGAPAVYVDEAGVCHRCKQQLTFKSNCVPFLENQIKNYRGRSSSPRSGR